jgi:hypothetical protein
MTESAALLVVISLMLLWAFMSYVPVPPNLKAVIACVVVVGLVLFVCVSSGVLPSRWFPFSRRYPP